MFACLSCSISSTPPLHNQPHTTHTTRLELASLQRHQGSQNLAETHEVGQQSWGSRGEVSVAPETGTRNRILETHSALVAESLLELPPECPFLNTSPGSPC